MAMKLYNDVDIQDIADAIREVNGSSDTYKVSEMADAIRALISRKSLLNLNRTASASNSHYFDESVYINPSDYGAVAISGTACGVSNLSENSITVTEGGTGGRGCAYPFDISEYYGKTLTLTWDATGTSNTRFRLMGYGNSNWKHAVIDNTGAKNTSEIVIASDGKTITVDGTAITASSNPFTFISFFFGAATSKTVAYSNVFLESN